jgi:hypothetical protein
VRSRTVSVPQLPSSLYPTRSASKHQDHPDTGMLGAKEVACANNLVPSGNQPTGDQPVTLYPTFLRWRNSSRLSFIDQLQVDDGLVDISKILSVRGDMRVCCRIARRIGSEPAGPRFGPLR